MSFIDELRADEESVILGKTIRKVKVFRDSPIWDTCDCWPRLPGHLLRRLYICSYHCPEDNMDACLKEIERKHPGCVSVLY